MPAVTVRSIPEQYALAQNAPNPFNPETSITYDLPVSGRVKLVVYDVNGQVVRRLVNTDQPAGRYTVRWDGKDEARRSVASGIYFYRIESGAGQAGSGSFSDVKRMILIK
jgi:flagellar hook assembly protein FlgD